MTFTQRGNREDELSCPRKQLSLVKLGYELELVFSIHNPETMVNKYLRLKNKSSLSRNILALCLLIVCVNVFKNAFKY